MRAPSGIALPPPVEPMLATAGTVPAEPGWSAEFKWDGLRGLVSAAGSRWRLLTRTGRDASEAFPEFAILPKLMGGRDVTVDAEVVALDAGGRPSFALLQQRMAVRRPDAGLLRRVPVTLYVFDVLYLAGQATTGMPYRARREQLEELALHAPAIVTPPHFPDAGAEVLAVATDRRLEGVVCKRDDGRYLPGRRSPVWIKTVIPHTADVVVCGWLPGRGRLQGSLGALLLGAYDRAGRLHYVGRVGTGLTGVERRRLQAQLSGVRRSTAPVHAEALNTAAVTRVEPILVARWHTAPGHPRPNCATRRGAGCNPTTTRGRHCCPTTSTIAVLKDDAVNHRFMQEPLIPHDAVQCSLKRSCTRGSDALDAGPRVRSKSLFSRSGTGLCSGEEAALRLPRIGALVTDAAA